MILPTFLWLIPALPLLGAAMCGAIHLGTEGRGGEARKGWISGIACGAMWLSFLVALVAAAEQVAGGGGRQEQVLWEWVAGGGGMTADGALAAFRVPVGLMFDGLTAVMALVVTFVGALIHVYSIGYMGHEEGYGRFFAYLNLFIFFMLVLVLGNSFPMLFVGWEGVGLCSYLLIGFYYREKWPQDAAVKAFVTNRVGDVGFLIGMLWIFVTFGSVHIGTVMERAGTLPGYAGSWTAFGIAMLLFVGATGKSAQIPLYVWLPDAMAGPTPVSALIHAATMVTAGVYLVGRCGVLFGATALGMGIVAGVGCVTALFAASMGLVATDIKKVLAYSTVSQLGYMFLGMGVGASVAGIFHLMTHAFFKALLFLGAGSVIHAMGGEQDIRKMGGLRKWLPRTHGTFWVACMAIAGVFPFAGFFSKDEILWGVWSSGMWPEHGWYARALWGGGVAGALMTAFYMWRLYYVVFAGEERWEGKQTPHESPRVMTGVLMVLAAGAIGTGFLGLPHLGGRLAGWNGMEKVLGPALAGAAVHEPAGHGEMGTELLLMGLSLAVAVGGILWARSWYSVRGGAPAARLAAAARPLHRLLVKGWFVDELYWGTVLHPYRRLSEWLRRFDHAVVDGAVNGSAATYKVGSRIMDFLDRYVVDMAVKGVGLTSKILAGLTSRLQTGFVANYMIFVVFGVFLLACVYVLI